MSCRVDKTRKNEAAGSWDVAIAQEEWWLLTMLATVDLRSSLGLAIRNYLYLFKKAYSKHL